MTKIILIETKKEIHEQNGPNSTHFGKKNFTLPKHYYKF
jgi:hypothetical protein